VAEPPQDARGVSLSSLSVAVAEVAEKSGTMMVRVTFDQTDTSNAKRNCLMVSPCFPNQAEIFFRGQCERA